MLQYAFKEWAAICEALGHGTQSIILRKGGIAESEGDGAFSVAQTRFWLYPTYTHQQVTGINVDARPLLAQAVARKPPAGKVRLEWWAELDGVYQLRDELPALMLSHLHCWSEEAVRKRFNYRVPGLHVLVVRVHRAPKVHEIDDLPRYAGCKSWVELEAPLTTEGAMPVLSDADFRIVTRQLDMLLKPSAYA